MREVHEPPRPSSQGFAGPSLPPPPRGTIEHMSDSFGLDRPLIGVMQWVPGNAPPAVREVAPTRCPFEGHDLTIPGNITLGWVPGGATGWRSYTCWVCYRKDARPASWRVERDDDAMWRASGTEDPRKQKKRPPSRCNPALRDD
jgi:hypothetical protein